MKIGNLDISSFKVGGADCSIYLGDTKLYPTDVPPTPTCETPENLETFALDDDFDTTKAVWSLCPDNSADMGGEEEEEIFFNNAYVVLSEDGQTPDYTVVANIKENDDSTLDICEYDENGENFAGLVLTALTTAQGDDLSIGMCDYFGKSMYVMDFSQYPAGNWQVLDDGELPQPLSDMPIYKLKMLAQDIYDNYGLDNYSGQIDLNDADDGSGTPYGVGYTVEYNYVDDYLEATIYVTEDDIEVTSYTFDLSFEEAVVDFYALFDKPLYADDCNMKCVDGDDENCSLYAPLWDASVGDGTKINEFEVETEIDE